MKFPSFEIFPSREAGQQIICDSIIELAPQYFGDVPVRIISLDVGQNPLDDPEEVSVVLSVAGKDIPAVQQNSPKFFIALANKHRILPNIEIRDVTGSPISKVSWSSFIETIFKRISNGVKSRIKLSIPKCTISKRSSVLECQIFTSPATIYIAKEILPEMRDRIIQECIRDDLLLWVFENISVSPHLRIHVNPGHGKDSEFKI